MISRFTFIKLMNAVQRQFEHDRRVGKAIDQLSVGNDPDSLNNNRFSFVTPLSQTVIDSLSSEMNDKYGDIIYYVYDTEFGRKADEYYLTLKDGSQVKFYTAGHVYDYLTRKTGDA